MVKSIIKILILLSVGIYMTKYILTINTNDPITAIILIIIILFILFNIDKI